MLRVRMSMSAPVYSLVVEPRLCYPPTNEEKKPRPMAKNSNATASALRVVGHSVTRVDAHAKVTGAAEFSADRMTAKNLLHGKTLRCSYAHAEIAGIDTSKAESLPGVRALVTYRDAPAIPFEAGDDSGDAPVYLLNKILRHVG